MTLLKPKQFDRIVKPKRLTLKQLEDQNLEWVKNAIRKGTVDKLYWLIRFRLDPRSQYVKGASDDGDNRIACWPEYNFPVVPLKDDLYCCYAPILLDAFKAGQAKQKIPIIDQAEFYLSMISIDHLEEFYSGRWYIWGELMIDQVCPSCGAVYRLEANDLTFCDCLTWRNPDPNPLGLMHVKKAFSEGYLWEIVGESVNIVDWME